MTVTIDGIVGQTRSLLNASLGAEFTLLTDDYTPGDATLKLRSGDRMSKGTTISVGLTTFFVLEPGKESTVIPGTDGSPSSDIIPANTIVLLRPRHTTWQVFTEIVGTVSEVCSPKHGLYGVTSESFPVDVVDGTYVLSQPALKVLRVRYLRPGSHDDWYDIAWAYQPGAPAGPTIRAQQAPGGSTIQVQYAVPWQVPTSLDDTLESLNIPDSAARLLAVGAARNLSLSNESRRNQPFSQGDPRRAEEVPSTGNVVVYDRLVRQFRDLVAEQRARLISQHPYRVKMEQFTGGSP